MRCSYCGAEGHPATCCPKNGSASHLRCSYCGGTDHNYEACTKHHGGGRLPGAIRLIRPGPQPHHVLALSLLLGRRP